MWDGIERRRENRKPDNFTPSTAFEGYVKASLDNMEKRLDSLPCPESFKRLNKVENEVSNIKGKAAVIGTAFGLIAGGIVAAFKWFMGGK